MTNFNYDHLNADKRQHFVYWCYDSDGTLLYVGCTVDVRRRMREHWGERRYAKRWVHSVAAIRCVGPLPYAAARAIERQFIATYAPHLCGRVLNPLPAQHDLMPLVARYATADRLDLGCYLADAS